MAIEFSCPCGQPLMAGDQQAGMDMSCPKCESLVRVPSASAAGPGAAPLLGYVGSAGGNPMVTPRAIEMIRQTTLWVRIMSILMFIGSGLMLVGGAAMIVLGLAVQNGRDPGPAILGCVYIPLAVLYIVPAVFLWRYATHTKAFARDRLELSLEEALQAQKSFWKYVAIMALVVIGLYVVMIAVAIIVAVIAAAHR